MREIQPLTTLTDNDTRTWVKQRVINVIRSYHNAADVIAEPIQNAVDEVLSAPDIAPIGDVRIVFDTDENRISVRDNGRGMSSADVERYLAPDVGNKRAAFLKGLVRGHKGVGLTFLAYGFNLFEIESRTESEHYIVRLEGGRKWVEDEGDMEPPVGRLEEIELGGGRLQGTGTIVTIALGPQSKPRSLRHAFPSAAFAVTAIRNQTAAGIIEPPRIPKERDLNVTLEYRSHSETQTINVAPTYRHPHNDLQEGYQTLDIGAWLRKNRNSEPSPKERRAYHACYWRMNRNELLELIGNRTSEQLSTREEIEEFVDKHDVHVYTLFAYSAKYREHLGESWSIPGNRQLHYPAIRIGTDGMISSWSREMSLTHRGFNVDRTWLLYTFRGIEPDLGRKDFPPEVHDFLDLTEEIVSNEIARQSRPFMRPTAPRTTTPEGYIPPQIKAYKRRENPLSPAYLPNFGEICLRTEPASEQDVIALYSELTGLGVFRHFKPVFYSGFDFYDSYFEYSPESVDRTVRRLYPGEDDLDVRAMEGVAEFKYRGDSVIEDVVRSVKRWTDMTFLVCWDIGKDRKYGGDEITFTEPGSASDRLYHGVTHLARLQTGGEHTVFVISLKDLMRRLGNEDEV
ncbi:ATP-binding protein [Streptomyces canus]|uniref:ATP-binding protein n=1 Tax=Streptomyces canus TaxID=58343 RepID=UPI0030E29314